MGLALAGTGGISGHLYFAVQALESFEKEGKLTSVAKLLQISSFLRSTLKEESFAGRKFREFREFWPNLRK